MSFTPGGNGLGGQTANPTAPAQPQTNPVTGGYQTPAMTSDELKELNNENFPKRSKTAMIFNIAHPQNISEWLEFVKNTFDTTGTTSDKVKLAKCFEWMTLETRNVFQHWDCVTKPNFDKFCKKLAETFPELLGNTHGSKNTLHRYITQFAPIHPGEREKLKVYTEVFRAEAAKLMKATVDSPAILSNSDAVTLYISAFSQELINIVHMRLQQSIQPTVLSKRRFEDPFLLSEVIQSATGADVGSSFQGLYRVVNTREMNTGYGVASAESYFRSPLAIPVTKEVPISIKGYNNGFTNQSIKSEENSEAQVKIAAALDKYDALFKELKDVRDDFKSVKNEFNRDIGEMRQLWSITKEAGRGANNKVGMNTQQLSTLRGPKPVLNKQGRQMTLKEFACFMCGDKSHMMGNCPKFLEFLTQGWIVPDPNGGKMMFLKDGQKLPRGDDREAMHEKIRRIAKEQGWSTAEVHLMTELEEDNFESQLDQSPTASWMIVSEMARM